MVYEQAWNKGYQAGLGGGNISGEAEDVEMVQAGGRAAPRHPSWIRNKGKLGGPGFLSRAATVQHSLLNGCVSRHGYRSCLDSVLVLARNRKVNAHFGPTIRSLSSYLKTKFGSPRTKTTRKTTTRKTPRKAARKMHAPKRR
jgi:hypothetical protein